jgi:lipoprotein signal peptidase
MYRRPMESRAPAPIARSLFAFSIFYGGMVCIAGVLGNKQVALGPLAVEAGIFAFLLLVVTSSAIAELYGRQIANRLVQLGFIPLIVSLFLTLVVLAVLGGAVGNLIDRATSGYVLDFVDAYWGDWHFWAFNVADAAIVAGVVGLVYDSLVLDKRRERQANP